MFSKRISRRSAVLAAVLTLGLAVSGCAGSASKNTDLPCPETGLVYGAGKTTFYAGSGNSQQDVQVMAELANYRGGCRMSGDILEFELEVDIAALRGAAGGNLKRGQFPYFIAILNPQENVLQRQGFSSTVSFDKNGIGMTTEKHVLRLPLADTKTVRLHKVVMGFELTADQLARNRDVEKTAPQPAAKGQKPPAAAKTKKAKQK